jgi:hypothetical protein
MISETTAALPGISDMVELHLQEPIKVRGRRNIVTPSIAGTPNRKFGLWLMEALDHILQNPLE